MNIDSLEAILFELWLINFAISRLSGGVLDDLPSIIRNPEMEQSCFYIIVGCNNIKGRLQRLTSYRVDIEVKHNRNYCSQRPVHQHRPHLRPQQQEENNSNNNKPLQQHQIETTQYQHTKKRDQHLTERVHLQRGYPQQDATRTRPTINKGSLNISIC